MAPPAEAYAPKYHDVYPGIDPSKFTGINKGKVVFITGASKGIGLASAKAFAQSGASLFISARSTAVLEKVKQEIEAEFNVPVGYATIDVSQAASVKAGVEAAVKEFGKIDIVISNAGGGEKDAPIGESDPDEWWSTIELNLKGSYLVTRFTIPELEKTQGRIVYLSSALAQFRVPGGSAYNISKHAFIRLAEWVTVDHGAKGVKAFAIHPGAIMTEFGTTYTDQNPHFRGMFIDKAELCAWTEVRITSGSEDWLSGRFYDATWGFEAVEELKEKIIDQDALKNRLALPNL